MLRSIIAIWTIALALLAVAATSGCENGCLSGDSSCDPGVAPPDMVPYRRIPDLAPSCAQECGSCGTDQICFHGSVTASLPSFCARPCTDDRDCASSDRCAQLFASAQPTVCVGLHVPVGCSPATPDWHCDFPPASCKDANTAEIPFNDAVDRVCGWEIRHCANGCANGACL